MDPAIAAVVNGRIIKKADLDSRVAQSQVYFLKQPGFDPASEEGKRELEALRGHVLDWMIDQVLIEQQAAAQGIAVSEETLDAEIARMKGQDETRFNQWLAASGLTLATLREQMRVDLITAAMRDRVTASLSRDVEQVRLRHILLSEEVTAGRVLQQLRQGENFIILAREFSEDETTRNSGGDLGFLPRGVMPPVLDQIAFALQPGEYSDVVHSQSGLHIIQLVEIDPERRVPDTLWPMVQQRAFEEWLAEQRAKAEIQRSVPASQASLG